MKKIDYQKLIVKSYSVFLLGLPFVFYTKTNEVFEFNKIVVLYLFTIIVVYLWALRCITDQKIYFRKSLIDYALILFLASNIISTIFSIDIYTSIFGYYTRFNGGLISQVSYALIYWAFVSNVKKIDLNIIIESIILSTILVSAWGVFEHYGFSPSCLLIKSELSSDCWNQDIMSRVFASFGQPNWMGAYLAVSLPLIIYKYRKKYLNWSAILIFCALLFTRSRSALLAFIISYLYLLFSQLKYLKYLLILGILLISFALLIKIPKNNDVLTTQNQESLLITPSIEIRKLVWRGAVEVWKENPIIGTGVETFAYSYYQKRPLEHNLTSEWNYTYNKAHNEYLNYLSNNGLLGLISYISLIIVSLYILRKIKNEFKYYLIASYLGILITNFFGFSVINISILFIIIPGIAVVHLNKPIYVNINLHKQILLAISTIMFVIFIFILRNYYVADLLFEKAQKQMNDKNYKTAQPDFELSINLNQFNITYQTEKLQNDAYIAVSEQDNNLINQTDEKLTNLVNKSSNNLTALKMIANIYSDMGLYDKSYYLNEIMILEHVIAKSPTDARTINSLALAYFKAENQEKALENLETAIRLKFNYDKAIELHRAIIQQKI